MHARSLLLLLLLLQLQLSGTGDGMEVWTIRWSCGSSSVLAQPVALPMESPAPSSSSLSSSLFLSPVEYGKSVASGTLFAKEGPLLLATTSSSSFTIPPMQPLASALPFVASITPVWGSPSGGGEDNRRRKRRFVTLLPREDSLAGTHCLADVRHGRVRCDPLILLEANRSNNDGSVGASFSLTFAAAVDLDQDDMTKPSIAALRDSGDLVLLDRRGGAPQTQNPPARRLRSVC